MNKQDRETLNLVEGFEDTYVEMNEDNEHGTINVGKYDYDGQQFKTVMDFLKEREFKISGVDYFLDDIDESGREAREWFIDF